MVQLLGFSIYLQCMLKKISRESRYIRFLYESSVDSIKLKNFDNWIVPPDDVLEREYHVEFELKGLDERLGFPFEDSKDFVEAVKNSPIEDVGGKRISYRSHTRSKVELLDLIRTYRSYPEFRNEDTVEAIYDGFKNNDPMELPIVLDFGDSYRILSGNTRMDIADQLGVPVKAIFLKIDN